MATNEAIARMVARYEDVICKFIHGEMSASDFEACYLRLFKTDKSQVSGREFLILDRLFSDVDEYTSDPELRSRAGGLNDEELRACARVAYEKLYEN